VPRSSRGSWRACPRSAKRSTSRSSTAITPMRASKAIWRSCWAPRCTARSVILVHDTMNAEVRAGVESVSLDGYTGVVYYELDFVPGYVYRTGAARNSAWGGLGLILTDLERCDEYALSPRQTLYHEPFAVLQNLRASLAAQEGFPQDGSNNVPEPFSRC
jgi:hypothetical protein